MPIQSALSPAPSSQGKGSVGNGANIASVTKEYLEAVSVLNEDTMNRACHLLMKAYDSDNNNEEADADPDAESSTTTSVNHQGKKKGKTTTASHIDGGGDNNNELPVKDQLLEMYYKCQESLNVIRKQQSLPSLVPGSAISGSGIKKGQIHHKMLPSGVPSLNGLKKRTVMTSKHGIHPSHKSTSSAIGLGVGALKQKGMMPMAMKRLSSLHKLENTSWTTSTTAKGTSGATAKAMMLSGRGRSISPPQSAFRSEDSASSSAAPPPSALSFLAKLNRDPNEAAIAGDDNGGDAVKRENEEPSVEKESTECSRKKKKKSGSKQKINEEEGNTESKDRDDKNNEIDNKEEDKKEVEDREGQRKKRTRPGKNSMDDDPDKDNPIDPPPKRKKLPRRGDRISKRRPVIEDDDDDDEDDDQKSRQNEEEEESSPPSSESDNGDGDTSADETYHGRTEASPTKRKSFSRKAKPDAETLAGGVSPQSKKRKSMNYDNQKVDEIKDDNSDDASSTASPSRRRSLRRASTRTRPSWKNP